MGKGRKIKERDAKVNHIYTRNFFGFFLNTGNQIHKTKLSGQNADCKLVFLLPSQKMKFKFTYTVTSPYAQRTVKANKQCFFQFSPCPLVNQT